MLPELMEEIVGESRRDKQHTPFEFQSKSIKKANKKIKIFVVYFVARQCHSR